MLRTTFATIMGAPMCFVAPARAESGWCDDVFASAADYPPLPDLHGADISGEAGIELYLQSHRAVVEHDGCLYEVGARGLEIGFAGLDQASLLVELPDHPAWATVFVSKHKRWAETLEVEGGSFSYVLTSGVSVGLEIAGPRQSAPTVPVIVTKPTDDPPDPT
jgi:hypothetical protein